MPDTTTVDAIAVGASAVGRPLSDMTLEELANAANRDEGHGEGGAALAELMRRTEADPKALIRAGRGNLARLVAALLVNEPFRHRPAQKAAASAQHKQVRESLEGPRPTPIEAVLAERTALDWLHLHVHEITYSMDRGTHTMLGIEHLERVRDRLHRRYLTSLRALASVRKLDLSRAMLIVGGVQQVNLTGSHPPASPAKGRPAIDAVGQSSRSMVGGGNSLPPSPRAREVRSE